MLLLESSVCMSSLRSVVPRVFLARIPFLALFITIVTIFGSIHHHSNHFGGGGGFFSFFFFFFFFFLFFNFFFLAHVLSWVKFYDHPKFQSISHIVLARMMIQTGMQTFPFKCIDLYIERE